MLTKHGQTQLLFSAGDAETGFERSVRAARSEELEYPVTLSIAAFREYWVQSIRQLSEMLENKSMRS